MKTERVIIALLISVIVFLLIRGDTIEAAGAAGIVGLLQGLLLGVAWKFNEPQPDAVGEEPR